MNPHINSLNPARHADESFEDYKVRRNHLQRMSEMAGRYGEVVYDVAANGMKPAVNNEYRQEKRSVPKSVEIEKPIEIIPIDPPSEGEILVMNEMDLFNEERDRFFKTQWDKEMYARLKAGVEK